MLLNDFKIYLFSYWIVKIKIKRQSTFRSNNFILSFSIPILPTYKNVLITNTFTLIIHLYSDITNVIIS